LGQAGWFNPSEGGSQGSLKRGRIHQLLWRVSQPATMRLRSLAARGDEKPLRAGSSNAGRFRACVNRSYPEGTWLLLCASTGRATLAVPKAGFAKRKTPKGGTNGARVSGRTRGHGKARENLPRRRRCYKRHRWLVSKRQPESEEARPVARGQRTGNNWWPSPRRVVKTRKQSHKRVLTWFASRWRNHQPKRA
jgi:hypothetical protein